MSSIVNDYETQFEDLSFNISSIESFTSNKTSENKKFGLLLIVLLLILTAYGFYYFYVLKK